MNEIKMWKACFRAEQYPHPTKKPMLLQLKVFFFHAELEVFLTALNIRLQETRSNNFAILLLGHSEQLNILRPMSRKAIVKDKE